MDLSKKELGYQLCCCLAAAAILILAGDVKYSWERLFDPEISDYGYLLQNVQGQKNFLNGMS
ncbi:MAG: hypothetical protein WBJ83_01445 [Thermacetogeniaceae bacterium]|jgi:hypothetical protein|nr:hypothetical protein [Syntrophomonadaceae bacterium]